MVEEFGKPLDRYENYQSQKSFKDVGKQKLLSLTDSYPQLINFIPKLLHSTIQTTKQVLSTMIKSHLDSLYFQFLKKYESSQQRSDLIVQAESALKQIQKTQNSWKHREEIGFNDITQIGRFQQRFQAIQDDVHALSNSYNIQSTVQEDQLYTQLKKLVKLNYTIDPNAQLPLGSPSKYNRERSQIRIIKQQKPTPFVSHRAFQITDDKNIQTVSQSAQSNNLLTSHANIIQSQAPSIVPPTLLQKSTTIAPPQNLDYFNRERSTSKFEMNKPQSSNFKSRKQSLPFDDEDCHPYLKNEEKKTSPTNSMVRSRTKPPQKVKNKGKIRYLIQAKQKSNQILVADTLTKQLRKVETSITFSKLFAIVQLNNAAFIAGGNNATKSAYLVHSDGQVIIRASMNQGRSCLSLTTLGDDYIYACGGFRYQGLTNCEKFDMKKNNWDQMPELNEGRFQHSSCSFGDRYLYVFGGHKKSSIERLDTQRVDKNGMYLGSYENNLMKTAGSLFKNNEVESVERKNSLFSTQSGWKWGTYWQIVELEKTPEEWGIRSFHVSAQLDDQRIIVFGPHSQDQLAFILTPSTKQNENILSFSDVVQMESIPETSSFRRSFCVKDGNVLLFDYDYQFKGLFLSKSE